MAYSETNPPLMITQTVAAHRIFYYTSTNAVGAVDATGFFTNGLDLGLGVGDKVIVYQSSTGTPKMTDTHVSAVSSTGATVIIEAS